MPPVEQVQILKEDDITEQLHQEKKDLEAKVEKLEKTLHTLNTDQRQADIARFTFHPLTKCNINTANYSNTNAGDVQVDECEIVPSMLLLCNVLLWVTHSHMMWGSVF